MVEPTNNWHNCKSITPHDLTRPHFDTSKSIEHRNQEDNGSGSTNKPFQLILAVGEDEKLYRDTPVAQWPLHPYRPYKPSREEKRRKDFITSSDVTRNATWNRNLFFLDYFGISIQVHFAPTSSSEVVGIPNLLHHERDEVLDHPPPIPPRSARRPTPKPLVQSISYNDILEDNDVANNLQVGVHAQQMTFGYLPRHGDDLSSRPGASREIGLLRKPYPKATMGSLALLQKQPLLNC